MGVVVLDNFESLLIGLSGDDRTIVMVEVFRALRDEADARSLVIIVVSRRSHEVIDASSAKAESAIIGSLSHTVLNLRRPDGMETNNLPAHRHVAMEIAREEKLTTANLVFIGELRRFRDGFTS